METQITKRFKVNEGEVITEVLFIVKSEKPLDDVTIQEIESADLSVFWSDTRCVHWSFDTKLSNGLWLENINYNNELTAATALVLN